MDQMKKVFEKWHLANEFRLGATQYLSMQDEEGNSETCPLEGEVQTYELSGNTVAVIRSLQNSDFDKDKKTFATLWGVSERLKIFAFAVLLHQLSVMMCEGSALCLDYKTSGENSCDDSFLYTENEIMGLLSMCGFLVYEDLSEREVANQFCKDRKDAIKQEAMKENKRVLLAIKKEHRLS